MMEILKKIYRCMVLPACLVSTVLSFTFSLIIHLSDKQMTLPMINLENLTQIFVFSLIFVASFRLFSIPQMAFWLALFCHFILFLGNIFVVFFLIGKHYTNGRNAFIVIFLFALLYIIIATIWVTIRHIMLVSKRNSSTYKRQF